MISILSKLRIVSFETKDLIGWKREQIRYRFVKKKKLGHLWKKIQNGNHSHDQLLPACENTLWENSHQTIGCFRSSQYNVWWWIALLRIIKSCWKNFFTLKINWPVSTSTLSGVPSILSTICEFKVCYQSCSLQRASFTLKAILIRVERVSTIRLRSGTVLVNLKYFDVIVLLLCITYIYKTWYITYIYHILTHTIHQQYRQMAQGLDLHQWAALWLWTGEIQPTPGNGNIYCWKKGAPN